MNSVRLKARWMFVFGVIGFVGVTNVAHAGKHQTNASFKQAKSVFSAKAFNLPQVRTQQVARVTNQSVAQRTNKVQRYQQAKRHLAHAAKAAPVKGILNTAGRFVGWKYRYGGSTPRTSFDCSGLVQYSYRKGANVSVPRTAAAQYKASLRIPKRAAKPGDLVFFNTQGRRISHVGLYLGNNRFLHAPRTGKRIQVSRIKGYWGRKFRGFGRIPGACRIPAALTRAT